MLWPYCLIEAGGYSKSQPAGAAALPILIAVGSPGWPFAARMGPRYRSHVPIGVGVGMLLGLRIGSDAAIGPTCAGDRGDGHRMAILVARDLVCAGSVEKTCRAGAVLNSAVSRIGG